MKSSGYCSEVMLTNLLIASSEMSHMYEWTPQSPSLNARAPHVVVVALVPVAVVVLVLVLAAVVLVLVLAVAVGVVGVGNVKGKNKRSILVVAHWAKSSQAIDILIPPFLSFPSLLPSFPLPLLPLSCFLSLKCCVRFPFLFYYYSVFSHLSYMKELV